jgi:hypothetical protein
VIGSFTILSNNTFLVMGKFQNFNFCILSRSARGSAQPPIQWVPGDLSLGVKGQGLEADHSFPSNPCYVLVYSCMPSSPSS